MTKSLLIAIAQAEHVGNERLLALLVDIPMAPFINHVMKEMLTFWQYHFQFHGFGHFNWNLLDF